METKKYEFEGYPITFLNDKNIIVNATEMAKRFSCQPIDWLKTDGAQRLIVAYSVLKNISTDDLVIVRRGGEPDKQGTWFHQYIALAFAHWLSPDFYIWCNDRIFELYEYGITALRQEDREKLFTLSEFAVMMQKQYPYKVGKYKVYEDLRLRGLLDAHNKPLQKWIDRGLFGYKLYRDDEYPKYPVVTEEGFKQIIQILFPQAVTNPQLETKMDLALSGIEVLMENILISKAGSINTPEQSKMMVEKMRNICTQIKEIREDASPIVNISALPTQLKLERY